MTDLVQQASDDQVALAICFGAVAFCGLVMYFSHHVGQLTGHLRISSGTERTASLARSSASVAAPAVAREKAA
jgi:hypothetical protein